MANKNKRRLDEMEETQESKLEDLTLTPSIKRRRLNNDVGNDEKAANANLQIEPIIYHSPISLYKNEEGILTLECESKKINIDDSSFLFKYGEIKTIINDEFNISLRDPFRFVDPTNKYECARGPVVIENLNDGEFDISCRGLSVGRVLEEPIKIGVEWNDNIKYKDFYPSQSLICLFEMYAKDVPSDVHIVVDDKKYIIYDFKSMHRTANDIGIHHGSMIHIKNVEIKTTQQIFVKDVQWDKTYTLDVSPNYHIFDLKYKVRKKLGVSVKDQRLIFGSKQLADNWTLSKCDIKKESTVMLIRRLRGS